MLIDKEKERIMATNEYKEAEKGEQESKLAKADKGFKKMSSAVFILADK